jgi:uridine kinase
MPDRFDAERAEREAGPDGVIRDYENSYSMHHKMVEATRAEIDVLTERFKKAEAGLIHWNEEEGKLIEDE